MVLFFTAVLLISILGMTLLIGVKRWELTTGGVLGARMRPPMGRFFHGVLVWVERVLPQLLLVYIESMVRVVRRTTQRVIAYLVLHAEHMLEGTLRVLRHKTDVRRGIGEASLFLREVAEHKKKLLKMSRERIKIQHK